jgi:hypothetical protein
MLLAIANRELGNPLWQKWYFRSPCIGLLNPHALAR